MDPAFFSQQWCEHAATAANESTEVQNGFKDRSAFDLTVSFVCTAGTTVECAALFVGGRIVRWQTGTPDWDGPVATIEGPLDVWREAVEGSASATTFLVERQLKLKDVRRRVTYNYPALDALVATWAAIPTTWPA